MTAFQQIARTLRTFAGQATQGFMATLHNGFALLGLAVIFVTLALLARPELRQAGEARLMSWLQDRQAPEALLPGQTPAPAIERATAANPKHLPKEQAAVAFWLSKKYRVAPEPLSVLVAEAWEIGERTRIEPTLLLAVMAIESAFNPFAESPVGAQGLMQVMTRVHSEKYESFGGQWAAFDPVSNLHVGARILQDYIARTGSVEEGLRYYVGAANLPNDGGYGAKVLAEHARLQEVAAGRPVPFLAPIPIQVLGKPAPSQDKLARS